MLTKEQYELLCKLRDKIPFNEDTNEKILRYLAKLEFVRSTNYKPHDFIWEKPCDYVITEKGIAACEEYEKSLRQEDREVESLQIAEQANKKANRSNIISIVSIIISALFSAGSIVASVLISLYLNP